MITNVRSTLPTDHLCKGHSSHCLPMYGGPILTTTEMGIFLTDHQFNRTFFALAKCKEALIDYQCKSVSCELNIILR
ncbi:unnamed protein product, partial [Staurois parvus]